MGKLRKAVSYRRLERPYTRKSRYTAKNFVRASPHNLIVKYNMGDLRKKFPVTLTLVAERGVQIRHNALESARKSANRILELKCGKTGFFFALRVFPHHVLRENALASGAGADRLSTGMKMSFGKPIGIAAQVKQGKTIMEVGCEKKDILAGKDALRRAASKFPCACKVFVSEEKTVKAVGPKVAKAAA